MFIINTQLILHALLPRHINSQNNRRLTQQALRYTMRHISSVHLIVLAVFNGINVGVALLSRRNRRHVLLNLYKNFRFLNQTNRRTRALAGLSILMFRMANNQQRVIHVRKNRYVQAPLKKNTRRAITLLRPFGNTARGAITQRKVNRVIQRRTRILACSRTTNTENLSNRGTRRSI